jgi:hypothetical protein
VLKDNYFEKVILKYLRFENGFGIMEFKKEYIGK